MRGQESFPDPTSVAVTKGFVTAQGNPNPRFRLPTAELWVNRVFWVAPSNSFEGDCQVNPESSPNKFVNGTRGRDVDRPQKESA